jgi:hypothetical protein
MKELIPCLGIYNDYDDVQKINKIKFAKSKIFFFENELESTIFRS